MKKIMHAMMKSCNATSELISTSQEKKLTKVEKVQLNLHLLFCTGCRNFQKNTKELSAMMKTHKENN